MNEKRFSLANMVKTIDNLMITLLMTVPTYYVLTRFGYGIYGFYENVFRFLVIFAIVFIVCMIFMEGFRINHYRIHEIIFSTLVSVYITDVISALLFFVFYQKTVSIVSMVFVVLFQLFFTFVRSVVSNRLFSRAVHPTKTLIICDDHQLSMDYIKKVSEYKNSFKIEGVISPDDKKLFDVIDKFSTIHLVNVSDKFNRSITEYCLGKNKNVYVMPSLYDIMLKSSLHLQIDDIFLLQNKPIRLTAFAKFIKRTTDFLMSIFGLIVLSPLMLVVAIAIKISDGGKIFFLQERVTNDSKKFVLIKFRTMVMNAEEFSGAVLSMENDPRITPIGRFLRKTRIDEIPQFINVFLGDMSIIGPRPERDVFIEQYSKDYNNFGLRLNVKSGITGFAQVYGKYNTNPLDKLRMDLYYIANYSILLDIKILFLTLRTVFSKTATEGVKSEGLEWYSVK